jgi:hypothetical protein
MTLRQRLERYTGIRPVIVEGEPDAHRVFLQVTNQRFCIMPHCDTREEAEWTRNMLCCALEKIVRDFTGAD